MNSKVAILVVGVVFFVPLFMCIGFLVLVSTMMGGNDDDSTSVDGTMAPNSVKGIPDVVLDAYIKAAGNIKKHRPNCSGMRWSIIAGIGAIESNHGTYDGDGKKRSVKPNGDIAPPIIGPPLNGTNKTALITDTDNGKWDGDTTYDRAVGPGQFIPSTWKALGVDGNDDGEANPNNMFDSALSTAIHLCGKDKNNFNDAGKLRAAIFGYNHSDEYVNNVMARITEYDKLSIATEGSVSRLMILARARLWTDINVPYSMTAYHQPDGYRTDCSGFVSMAWNLRANGKPNSLNTGSLPSVARRISKEDLKPGDILLNTLAGSSGHVAIFEKWVDPSKKDRYVGYEEAGSSGAVHRTIPYPYFSNGHLYEPYRYNKLNDEK